MTVDSSSYCFWDNASQRVSIKDSSIHYLECGSSGSPILLLHGMPSSSFVWRNIMPDLASVGHVYAPDLIGMGLSDKPDIDYSIDDHIDYISNFIAALNLSDITLVMHGWGSVIGLDIAARNPALFKGLVLSESHLIVPRDLSDLSLPVQETLGRWASSANPAEAVLNQNVLLDDWLPSCVMGNLSLEELKTYQMPFQNACDRKVLLRYIQEFPIGNNKVDRPHEIIHHYSDWLTKTNIPKLLIYGVPGYLTKISTVAWAKEHYPNITCCELPDTFHFAQETSPDRFALSIKQWVLSLSEP